MDLMCDNTWKVGLIGSAYFLGWSATLLWVPRLSDKYGRKKFLVFGVLSDLFLYTMIFLCSNVNLMILILFTYGCVASCT